MCAGHVNRVDSTVTLSGFAIMEAISSHETQVTGWYENLDERFGAGGRAVEPRTLGPDLVEHGEQQISAMGRLLGEQLGIGAQVGAPLDPQRKLQMESAQERRGVAHGRRRPLCLDVPTRTREHDSGAETGEPRLDDAWIECVAMQEGHDRIGETILLAVAPDVGRRGQHAIGDDVEQHRQLESPEVSGAGQGGEQVGAMGDRVGPALLGYPPAVILLTDIPSRRSVTPVEHRLGCHEVLIVVAPDDFGEHQSAVGATQHRRVAIVAETMAQTRDDAVAEAREQVVVDALGDPGRQQRVGEVLAPARVGVSEHLDELDGALVEAAIVGNVHAVLHHRLPVRLRHPAIVPRPAHYPEFVPSLDDIARFQTSLTADDVFWLHALVTDWQIIADLSFSDLVLWVPDAEAKGVWAGAQIRPTTGPTTLLEDVAGTFLPTGHADQIEKSLASGEIGEEQTEQVADGTRFRVQSIPVARAGRTIAVISRRRSESALRTASVLENTYLEAAGELVEMIQCGEFPLIADRSDLADSLRVGDGLLRTDRKGLVTFASPNAMSAYRRLGHVGDLVGADLGEVTTGLVDRQPTDRAPLGVLRARTGTETEFENASAALLLRVIPLRSGGHRHGALILLRDVTELRLRERELVSKEATIREIHHRVKNNLQTVASLLRLQGRRTELPEVRAALDDAVRRVGSIALVHETLSQSFDDNVDFDEIADRLIRTVLEVSSESSGVGEVKAERIGSFGSLPGAVATPLAMALAELIQNAVEHAYLGSGGTLSLAVNRIRDRIRLRVSDDGAGLPPEFDPAGSLGLSIVTTLVEGELGGTLSFEKRRAGGTTVAISLTV